MHTRSIRITVFDSWVLLNSIETNVHAHHRFRFSDSVKLWISNASSCVSPRDFFFNASPVESLWNVVEAEKGIFERGTVSRGHASYSIARFAWGLAILRMPIATQGAPRDSPDGRLNLYMLAIPYSFPHSFNLNTWIKGWIYDEQIVAETMVYMYIYGE